MRVVRYSHPARLTTLRGFGAGPAERLVEAVDEAKAWAVIKGLQTGYVFAEGVIQNLTPQTLTEAFLNFSPVGQLIRLVSPEQAAELVSTQKQAALTAVRMNKDRIVRLKGDLFEAAKAGATKEGVPFTWTKWKEVAKAITEDLMAQVKYQSETNIFANTLKLLADMTVTAVRIVGGVVPPVINPWPWYVWAAGILAAAAGVAYVVNTGRAFIPATRAPRTLSA